MTTLVTTPTVQHRFASRGDSGPYTDNLLWQQDRLSVMDNHRLALWCWWQQLQPKHSYNLFHLDRHYDAAFPARSLWQESFDPAHRLCLDAYRTALTPSPPHQGVPLYQWNTFINGLILTPRDFDITSIYMAGVREGSPLSYPSHAEAELTLSAGLDFIIQEAETPSTPNSWIIDVDLDAFIRLEEQQDGFPEDRVLVLEADRLPLLGEALLKGLAQGIFAAVTVALSPDCCALTLEDGWEMSAFLFERLSQSWPSRPFF